MNPDRYDEDGELLEEGGEAEATIEVKRQRIPGSRRVRTRYIMHLPPEVRSNPFAISDLDRPDFAAGLAAAVGGVVAARHPPIESPDYAQQHFAGLMVGPSFADETTESRTVQQATIGTHHDADLAKVQQELASRIEGALEGQLPKEARRTGSDQFAFSKGFDEIEIDAMEDEPFGGDDVADAKDMLAIAREYAREKDTAPAQAWLDAARANVKAAQAAFDAWVLLNEDADSPGTPQSRIDALSKDYQRAEREALRANEAEYAARPARFK